MKLTKIYIKLSLSTLLIFLLVCILSWPLLRIWSEREHISRLHKRLAAHAKETKYSVSLMAKQYVSGGVTDMEALKSSFYPILTDKKVTILDSKGQTLIDHDPKPWRYSPDIGTPPFSVSVIDDVTIKQMSPDKLYRLISTPVDIPGYDNAILLMYNGGKALDKLRKEMTRVFYAIIIIFFISMCLIYLPVMFLILKPIQRIHQTVKNISLGNLGSRIEIKGHDELTDLAAGINHMAQQTEQMVTGTKDLAMNVSHEIRTPLSQANINLEILRVKYPPDEFSFINKKIDSIEEDIERVSFLVGRLLQYAKYDFSAYPADTEEIRIDKLILEQLNYYGLNEPSADINLQLQLPSTPCIVNANADDLAIALSNIIGNAVKYAKRNGDFLIKATGDKDRIELVFANECQPLSPGELHHIFDPFFKSPDFNSQGYGLGLAIVQKIVERWHGHISAKTWENRGLCLTINLPAR